MIQIRENDLIAVQESGEFFLFAILTKQILFGGHWTYVFHGAFSSLPSSDISLPQTGFNAAVDFIVPKRTGRVFKIRKGNVFSGLLGPELLQQEPPKGEKNYEIWRWKNNERREAEWIRSTQKPKEEEKSAPHYSCLPAEFACELASEGWTENKTKWKD